MKPSEDQDSKDTEAIRLQIESLHKKSQSSSRKIIYPLGESSGPKLENPLISTAQHSKKKETDKDQATDTGAAADFIRHKVDRALKQEPDAKEELLEAEETPAASRSKHQDYMHRLSLSGQSLVDIQNAWHEYYQELPNQEKHEVWHEFYADHETRSRYWQHVSAKEPLATPPKEKQVAPRQSKKRHIKLDARSVSEVRSEVLRKISSGGKLKAKHHVQSLLFGFGMASLVVLVLLFSFFNERFIAPFISPGSTVSSAPIIVDPNNLAVSPEPRIIIPKINVDAPVVYDVDSVVEADIQAGLERGVVQYANSPNPGEQGNTVIMGHSASNIFNRGKFKFAFLLLKSLEIGDTFTVNKDGKQYVYKVFEKKVVEPTDVSVLGPSSKPVTATLITCDPPGLSTRRLIIIGEQIAPDPAANIASSVDPSKLAATTTEIPSVTQTLWSRISNWLF